MGLRLFSVVMISLGEPDSRVGIDPSDYPSLSCLFLLSSQS
jgi:hypothetical protein